MPTFAPDWALTQVLKASKDNLAQFRQGIALEKQTSRTIEELQHRGCADRLELARLMLDAGNKLTRARPAHYRSAISRYYYAMYHASRAVVYFAHGGDDFEEHSRLPGYFPGDFPAKATWQNDLKNARLLRNDVDYEPYPDGLATYRSHAKGLQVKATQLLAECTNYLRSKGCQYV